MSFLSLVSVVNYYIILYYIHYSFFFFFDDVIAGMFLKVKGNVTDPNNYQ